MSDEPGAGSSYNDPNIEFLTYTMCQRCAHFVEPNDDYITTPGLAAYLHLDDGEKEHDHEAWPGAQATLIQWRRIRPDLFVTYSDGKIGPNSTRR